MDRTTRSAISPTRALILGLISAGVAAAAFAIGLSKPPRHVLLEIRAPVATPAPQSTPSA